MRATIRSGLRNAVAVAALLWAIPASAEDIDIYTGGETVTGTETNVLIVLDNSSNWSNTSGWTATQGEAELAALKTVIDTLTDNINVGVMMHTNSGSAAGGYVRFAMRPMNATNRSRLKEVFDDIVSTAPNAPQDKVAQSQPGDNTMEEAFRYFASLGKGFATADTKRDYLGNADYYATGGGVSATLAAKSHPATAGALGSHAYASAAATTYSGPATAALGCAKNFIIYIGNTLLSGSASSTRLAAAATAAGVTLAAEDLAQITAFNAQNTAPSLVMLDEWARFMKKYGIASVVDDPNDTSVPPRKLRNEIVTYTVDTFPATPEPKSCIGDTSGGAQQIDQHYVMQSAANAGGGKCYPGSNQAQLEKALRTIFTEIQAVNSVFASATLPVSVNTQGTFENQVYIGVFRPDGNARPRWFGNLKEYKFGRWCDANDDDLVDPGEQRFADNVVNPVCSVVDPDPTDAFVPPPPSLKLYLADRNNDPAIDQTLTTGFIDLNATSHWTQASTFWDFYPVSPAGASDAPDGPQVERGGAAYKLRLNNATTTAARNVYTCGTACRAKTPGSEVLSANPFNSTNLEVTAALAAPVTAKTVTRIERYGTTAIVTVPAGHGFTTGESVEISGTGINAYNGTKSVTSFSATQFAFRVPVLPRYTTKGYTDAPPITSSYIGDQLFPVGGLDLYPETVIDLGPSENLSGGAYTSWIPVRVGVASTTYPVTSLTIDPVTLRATAAVSGGVVPSVGDAITVSGSAQPFLQVPLTVSAVSGSNVSFPIAPAYPATPAGTVGTSKAGTSAALNNLAIRRTVAKPYLVQVEVDVTTLPKQLNTTFYANGLEVTLSGVVPAEYNGTWKIAGVGVDCDADGTLTAQTQRVTYCFSYLRSPDPASGLSLIKQGATEPGWLWRSYELSKPYSDAVTGNPASMPSSMALIAVGKGGGSAALVGSTTLTVTEANGEPAYNGVWSTALCLAGNSYATALANGFDGCTDPSVPVGGPGNDYRIFIIKGINESETAGFFAGSGQAVLSGGDTTTAQQLIEWVRGVDNIDDENNNNSKTDVRASIHADVLHSRPLMLNYGAAGAPTDIVGFYGTNDGTLRAIQGGVLDSDGNELWSFVPSDFINRSRLLRLYRNESLVRYPNLACGLGARGRDYFWDGFLTAYQGPVPVDGDPVADKRAYVFVGMRRGGRTYYALDVTDKNAPKFLWRISGDDPAPNPFAMLGQTWSEPKVVKIKGKKIDGGGNWVDDVRIALVFGAGYDNVDEDKPSGFVHGNRAGGYGYGVFVVDATTGALLNHLVAPTGRQYSIPADVTPVDSNSDGYIDRIYAVDTGANVIRFDLYQGDSAPSGTIVAPGTLLRSYHIARLGDVGVNGGSDARKFMFAPSVVPLTKDGKQAYNILVGSGNREKPLPNDPGSALTCTAGGYYPDAYFGTEVVDRFYAVFDTIPANYDPTTAPIEVVTDVARYPVTETLTDLQEVNADPGNLTPFNLNSTLKGWYVTLKQDTDGDLTTWDEEKAVNAPRVVTGVVFFATNATAKPDTTKGLCQNLGRAFGYAVDPFTGLPAFNRDDSVDASGNETIDGNDYAAEYVGAGLPPTVTAGVVEIGDSHYRFLIGGGGTGKVSASPVGATRVDAPLTGTRTKVYWYYRAEDN